MPIFSRPRAARLTQFRVADSPFGPIRINHDRRPAVAIVHVPGMPDVMVLPARDHDALRVDGQPVALKRGLRRWDPRRVARTHTALVGERGYVLRPTGLFRAQLLRDGRLIADAESSLAAYSPLRDVPGLDARLSWHPGVDPTDVAIGQAMVVGFGAGAPGALALLVSFWLDWVN